MEKRDTDRILIEAPIKVGACIGTTRDISSGGIYFVIDEDLKLDGDIRFSLELEHILPDKPLRLKCQGQIVRIEDLGDQKGVAAKIEKFCYLR